MKIIRYSPDRQDEWDEFIQSSRNGTFLFLRGYMDYHSDRFKDHSLMYCSDRGKLLSVMAANEAEPGDGGKVLYSHEGLTYGGLVLSPDIRMVQVMDIFDMTVAYLKELGFREWHYKQIPVCYHRQPSQEDEYALWRLGAEIAGCGISSCIFFGEPISQRSPVDSRRVNYFNKLPKQGYIIERNASIDSFWPILESNLFKHHNVFPVHSIDEIRLLQSRFPQQIECTVARNCRGEVEAGAVLYKMNGTVHIQYMSASEKGRKSKAMDFLILSVSRQLRESGIYRFLDFGISTEDRGNLLNTGLIAQKEGFGGRGVVYKQYRIKL